MAVGAFVAGERRAKLLECVEQWEEQATARGEVVFHVRRAPAEIAPFDERVLLHVAEATDERAAADRVQCVEEFGGPAGAARQIAHDEQRPFVAD